ncbi:MAG: efflux RND transporter permease subunit [Muribaculaceae bacterium]|nr:efflux RND transporter permease subunit [Muribaculaceae bacterium]
MFSRFFINRPIFATVIAIIMVFAGILTVKTLPVAQYPDITPPTVQVSATYPGADAKTVAETVGVPIEQQVNGVEGMMYMSSTSSSDGSYSLQITFENGTDVDMAAVKVQNRVALAEPSLPSSVQEQGVSVTSRSSNIILFIALEGDSVHNYSDLYLTNYANLNIVDELSRLEGVGGVNAFGAGEYSMRIWLKPEVMNARGITPADVVSAIESQNMQVSAGAVGISPVNSGEAFQYTLTSQGRLVTPAQFGDIIIKVSDDGSILRLRDIATIDLGSESYGTTSSVSGHNAGLLGIYQLPGANALDVAKRVEKKLDELQTYFPEGVHYRVIMDTTQVVSSSIDNLLITFAETSLIVMIVILIFLQSWRAVVIPMLTIPVSLIATFAVMKLMGFTLNTLTLFGLVLAIAIVVDDAIVVVEDCARIVDKRLMTPRQAALKAMKELQGPIVGEVLVLLSVFIPTAFISGISGQLYKQFALTIAVSTAFSGFNALTFTPAMCALFLKPRTTSRFFVYRWFNAGWAKTLSGYSSLITRMVKRPGIALGIYAIACAVAFWGFIQWPSSYIPEEDNGYFVASVQLPTGASLDRTEKVVNEVTDRLLAMDNVENVISMSGISFMGGGNTSNYGSFFVMLKPWNERKGKENDVFSIIDKVNAEMADIQEAVIFSINPPAIPGLGQSSGLELQLLDINSLGPDAMKEALDQITEKAESDPRFASVRSLYQGTVPQYRLNIDRDKVRLQNLSLSEVYSTLSAYMGGSYVNDFVEFGRVYQVNIEGATSSRDNIDDLRRLSVKNGDGQMVPVSSFMTIEPVMGQAQVNRYNMYETASLTATPAKNVSSGTGIKAMEQIVEEAVGTNYSYAWTGEAYQETEAGTTVTMVLLFAVILTLLVLSAQYESWTSPIAVIMSMPTAILGTIVGCVIMNQSVSIYTQIGIILLLGLSAKNAILIIEYAMDFRKSGMDIKQAAVNAGKIRLRPIMMTALAFVFGVMPMLFATGAGANSRIALGCAVVFGMAINAIFGTLFVPNFYAVMQSFNERYLSKLFTSADKLPTPSDGRQADTKNVDSGADDNNNPTSNNNNPTSNVIN